MTEQLVHIRGLGRRFDRRVALTGLDLDIGPGEIVGLAGPNGSGKTTLLRIIAGFLRPTSGSVRVFGLDPGDHRPSIMRRARFAFAPPPLYESLTAREHLEHLGDLGFSVLPSEAERALVTVGLADRADDRVRTFSFGMRQRLVLAQALIPVPELLILDEPTDGLDPLAILELRSVLRNLREEQGVAILLSSHLLTEVDRLVDRLLVLYEGRTVFSGPPGSLRGSARIRIVVDDIDRGLRVFREHGIDAGRVDGAALTLPAGALDLNRAAALLAQAGLTLHSFHEDRATLEQALLDRLRLERTVEGDV